MPDRETLQVIAAILATQGINAAIRYAIKIGVPMGKASQVVSDSKEVSL